jgi:DNA invertase Pin-like site-specific DNA recombinase
VHELGEVGVDLFIHKQGHDTTTTHGRLFFHIVASFAEYERDMIRDRVNAGLARARAAGVRLGRKPVARNLIRKITDARAEGLSVRAIAKKAGVSIGTVHRVLNGQHVSQLSGR